MADFIPGTMSFFFADDLAAVLAEQIEIKFYRAMYGSGTTFTHFLRTT